MVSTVLHSMFIMWKTLQKHLAANAQTGSDGALPVGSC